MAINFSDKFSSQIAKMFAHESFVKGVFSAKLDFSGVRTVKIYRLITTPQVDYQRSGLNRYGTPADIQDTVTEYTMTQDKAFSGIVDKGDESDQVISNKAAFWLREELRLECTPEADKYAFQRMNELGTAMTLTAAPTKDTVVQMFADARKAFTNSLVPDEGRIAFVPATTFVEITLCPQFINLEKLGTPAVGKGHVGQLLGFKLIEVPDSYLPEGTHGIFTIGSAACMPYKISETKIHKDPPGLSGALIEGRHYYDFFVLDEKKNAMLIARTS